ncbi:dihydrofolate reductase-like domain-containing protein [Neohortaea acidophila]|uniref:2,5-diamino-6-ribosylamino-4(3H)-pyrimidinone 5'-phosphate reductase n=1 Tax=Neohortaea acidophila TaxID=245834 RepID=A0A6A6PN92_9PEZI|nr:dihydrofolate reductase-like domain-containing protein [Neohortaea acidophila]KAF2481161.1 dihydrofolate reductase-like domain-containing protein [Neohortaea acidophila]
MTEISELPDAAKDFLLPYLPSRDTILAAPNRPHITLTYACSLDSMISLAPGVRTTLSGPETKSMTHYLRLKHDAILVGVGTAIADDPSLNCRYPGVSRDTQPRPFILDPSARWNVADSKVRRLASEREGKSPSVIHSDALFSEEQLDAMTSEGESDVPNAERVFVRGGHSTDSSVTVQPRHIDWLDLLRVLKRRGVNSMMIEGGATIINDLLQHPDLVDSVIITIAPTWLGQGGVTISPSPQVKNGERVNAANLHQTSWRQFGSDAVLCGRLTR